MSTQDMSTQDMLDKQEEVCEERFVHRSSWIKTAISMVAVAVSLAIFITSQALGYSERLTKAEVRSESNEDRISEIEKTFRSIDDKLEEIREAVNK